MTISNISKLENTESFLQVNFEGGYRYIDTAGEILNLYEKEMKAYNMDPRQLIISNPAKEITEIKISVNDFWGHFISINRYTKSSSEKIANIYIENARKVLKITSPGKFTRIGWRNYFIREFKNPVDKIERLSEIVGGRVSDVGKKIELADDVNAIINMKLLQQKKDQTKTAVLVDVDVYVEGDFNKISDVSVQLEKLRQAFLSKEILSHINNLLESI